LRLVQRTITDYFRSNTGDRRRGAMANEEQVKRLLQDVQNWNMWRAANFEIPVDLSGINLIGAFLSGAILSRANLSGADLSRANLIDTIMGNTDLSGATLISTNLTRTYLHGADLHDAELVGAVLSRANLSGANLINARLGETVFGGIDLTGVTGLETCIHEGPSTIDHRTLQYGPLPLAFLRGVGLPDNLIEYLPSLLNRTGLSTRPREGPHKGGGLSTRPPRGANKGGGHSTLFTAGSVRQK
jgi:Pentapeptide repeats (8 copies)